MSRRPSTNQPTIDVVLRCSYDIQKHKTNKENLLNESKIVLYNQPAILDRPVKKTETKLCRPQPVTTPFTIYIMHLHQYCAGFKTIVCLCNKNQHIGIYDSN